MIYSFILYILLVLLFLYIKGQNMILTFFSNNSTH